MVLVIEKEYKCVVNGVWVITVDDVSVVVGIGVDVDVDVGIGGASFLRFILYTFSTWKTKKEKKK